MARVDRTDIPGAPGSVRVAELIAYFVVEQEDRDRKERDEKLKAGIPMPPSVTPFGANFE